MPAVHRAFLSHSSNEKALVNRVARHFTAARVVVDSVNFEDAKSTVEEILTHLRGASVIGLFLSKASLDSNWVQFELSQALHRLGSDFIEVVAYTIDDLSRDKLPEWLRRYTIHRTNSPLRIAETIEGVLQALDQLDGYAKTFFVGRHEQQDNLLRAVSPIAAPAPSVIFLGGVEGIGKKTLLSKVIQDALGEALKTSRVKITLPDEGGLIEFFEMLTDYQSSASFGEVQAQLDDFRLSDENARIGKVVNLIKASNDERLLVTIVGRFGLVTEEGDIQPWLRNVIRELPRGRLPFLAVCSSRMVRGEFQEHYLNVAFQSVRNLLGEHSRDLLTLWLNALEVSATEQDVKDITAITGGRPYAIRRAAELVKDYGIGMVLARQQLRRLLSLGYESTIKQIKSPMDKSVVALLLHFDRLSLRDLGLAANSTITDVADSVVNLMANMIIENEADHYFIAPHLEDVLSRESWLSGCAGLCKDASAKLVAQIEQFKPDEYVSVTSLNAAVIGAIRRGEVPPSQLAKLLKPAQLLRVGKSLYDQSRYARSSEILGRALENHEELTKDAVIEGLRLRAMCLARLYHEQAAQQSEFYRIVENLGAIGTTRAKQSQCFVLGFQARVSGDLRKARSQYKRAIRDYGGDRNFHVLNEYTKVLLRLDEYDDALRYARLALDIAPTNPYVLDVVVTALIQRAKHLSEDNQKDIERLLGDLEIASGRMGTCHYQCCISRYYLKLQRGEDALEYANAAVEFIRKPPNDVDTDMIFHAHFTRAQCLFASRRYKEMDTNLGEIEKRAREEREFRRFNRSVLELRIRQLIALRDFDLAHSRIKHAIGIAEVDRQNLKTELEREEAYATR